jgi:S-formylglutathione hydrolase
MPGTWSFYRVADKQIEVYDPPKPPRFAVIFLHGIGLETLRERPRFTQVLESLNLACACPHGQRSWWVDRVCPEFDPLLTPEKFLLNEVLAFCRERWKLGDRATGLLGISMGGQAALRLAFKHAKIFPVAAGTASAIDYYELYGQGSVLDDMYDSKEQCRQDTATMHVPPFDYPPHIFFAIDPDDDNWFRGNDRLHEKLNALGVPHTFDFTTRAGGHSWQYFDHMAEPTLKFIHSGLEQESRRLL